MVASVGTLLWFASFRDKAARGFYGPYLNNYYHTILLNFAFSGNHWYIARPTWIVF